MVALPVGIYIFFVAVITTALPYEDDPRFYRWHDADSFTEVNEMLFVRRQTAASYFLPYTACQAMRKIIQVHANKFKYAVHYKTGTTPNQIQTFVTILTTSVTMSHRRPNAVAYQTIEGGPFNLYKVLYADRHRRCFILVFVERIGIRTCRLLQTSSTVDQPVPVECLAIYATHCPIRSIEIYVPICRQLLGQIRPPSPPTGCCN